MRMKGGIVILCSLDPGSIYRVVSGQSPDGTTLQKIA